MMVTVEGHITSIENKTKEDKKFTELLLAQKGQKEQITVRLNGHVGDNYELFEVAEFKGRLMTWKQREGVGSMIMAENV
ncbi:hypothetical protein [Campylobacter jejuni]